MTEPIRGFKGKHRFLSNFVPVQVEFAGEVYPSVEHAYQAAKTEHAVWRERIRRLKTPVEAKRMGRKVPMRKDWDAVKLRVMGSLLRQKFNREPFRSQLLATCNANLEETNEWGDMFWGVCRGAGRNYLGRILMQIRDELLPTGNYRV